MATNNSWNSSYPAGVVSGGTGAATFTAFSLICAGTTATGAFQNVVGVGVAGQALLSGGPGALPVWSTSTFPSVGGSAGNILISNGTNYIASTSLWPNTVGASGTILISNGTSNVYSTPTFPNAAGSSGNVLTSDGTNFVSSAPAGSVTSAITDDTATNAIMYPVWVTANTGSLPLKVSSTKLAFTPSTGRLTLTGALSASTGVTSSVDANLLAYTYTVSAVNYLSIVNNTTGNPPSISAVGADANVNLQLGSKGTGTVNLVGNGSNIAIFTPIASAVNYVNVTNNATGSAPIVSAGGTDANISLRLLGTGTGGVEVHGTGTNDDANPAYVGEFIESAVLIGSAVSVTTATATNVTSISLTAGDWDVWGNVTSIFTGNSTFTGSWISSTSATLEVLSLRAGFEHPTGAYPNFGMAVPQFRYSLSATTTIYLSTFSIFSTGTCVACGGMYARRVR